MRGSRLAGVLSISIGTIFPLGAECEHAAMPASKTEAQRARTNALGIVDHTQYGGAMSAGRARNIRRQAMPRLPCKKGEGHSFLGLRRETRFVARHNFAACRFEP